MVAPSRIRLALVSACVASLLSLVGLPAAIVRDTAAYQFKLPANHFDPSAPLKNPNPLAPEVIRKRNEARFPGETFPEGYDVGLPATSGTARSSVKWLSPSGQGADREARIWYNPDRPDLRPPGKLLLNMLVMNEEAHLTRTLPQWAKVIDYWIIGVDVKNTDNSEAIIKQYLGHLPGMIALVEGFDGHGPTWTTLVELGIKHFPGATHGIIADADFRPMQTHLDRRALDIRCSKHMYTVWDQNHANERRMDWAYRNVPGARITRRTHQVVEVPVQPEQEVYQTLLPFAVDEQPGGFGDRNPGKEERYIRWMQADLADFPDDPRALYYLGYGHLDLYHAQGGNNQTTLDRSIGYFNRRVDLPSDVGNKEERWFAMLKLAEIHERFKSDWPRAEAYYKRCHALDPVRADALFYLGQHFRLVGDTTTAEPYLYSAATLPMPSRSLFMWHYLYMCLTNLEYARNWSQFPSARATLKTTKRALDLLERADCTSERAAAEERTKLLKQAREAVQEKRAALRKSKKERQPPREEIEEVVEEAVEREDERPKKKKAKKENKKTGKKQERVDSDEEESQPATKQQKKTKTSKKEKKSSKGDSKKESTVESDSASDPAAGVDASQQCPDFKTSYLASDAAAHQLKFDATPGTRAAVAATDDSTPLSVRVSQDEKVPLVRQLMRLTMARVDEIDASGVQPRVDHAKETRDADDRLAASFAVDVYARLMDAAQMLSAYMEGFVALPKGSGETALQKRGAYLTCQRFRRATASIVRVFDDERPMIDSMLENETKMDEWTKLVDKAKRMCR